MEDYINARSDFRIEETTGFKKKIFARVSDKIDIAKGIMDFDDSIRKKKLTELFDYLSKTTDKEISQYGSLFPFDLFLNFILNTNDEEQRLLAFKILAISTQSEYVEPAFLMKPELFNLCNFYILNQEYSEYVFIILINGAADEKCCKSFLMMNVCDLLVNLPITLQLSQLVSNLTYHQSNYLQNLLTLIYKILDDQTTIINNQPQALINFGVICYAFKSLHHIYEFWDIPREIILEIHSQFTPIFYFLAPLILRHSNNSQVLNSVFRYILHLVDVKPEFGTIILEAFSNNNIEDPKTLRLGICVFKKNVESWRSNFDLKEKLLAYLLPQQNIHYKTRALFFKVILAYFTFSESKSDKNVEEVINWCLSFIEDSKMSELALKELISIKMTFRDNANIFDNVANSLPTIEGLIFSNEYEEPIPELASQLINLF